MPKGNLQIALKASIPFVLLVIFALLCYFSQKQKSVTVDEFCHFPSGIYNLATSDWRMDRETPPLIKCLPGLTALISKPEIETRSMTESPNSWRFGYDFMFRNFARYQQIFSFGRCVVIALGFIGGWMLYRFGTEIYGCKGGILALFLYVFNPNIIAHSRLTTIDAGATCTILLSVYCFWKFVRRISLGWSIMAGLALGMAQLSKFTALLLYPMFIIVFGVLCLTKRLLGGCRASINNKPMAVKQTGHFILMLLISLVFINAGYLFKGSCEPLYEYSFYSEPLRGLSSFIWDGLPLPVPREYINGLDFQLALSGGNHPFYAGYLMGQHSRTGWWYYYIVAFIVKNPVALSIVIMLTIYFWIRNSADGLGLETVLCVWVPAASFFIYFSLLTNIPIGIRFLLPAFPFLFLGAGFLLSAHLPRKKLEKAVVLVMAALYAIPAISIFPNYLSYFNLAAGGPGNGYKWLIDSNLDWGQDLPGLKKYMEDRGIKKIGLGYFGRVSPAIYGIDYELAGKEPGEGIYAISVNYLVGRPYYLLKENQNELIYVDVPYFDKYRSLKSVDVVGHTIHIFKIRDGDGQVHKSRRPTKKS